MSEIPKFGTASCSVISIVDDSPILRIQGFVEGDKPGTLKDGGRAEFRIDELPETNGKISGLLRWIKSQINKVGKSNDPRVDSLDFIRRGNLTPIKAGRLTLTPEGEGYSFSELQRCLEKKEDSFDITEQNYSSVTVKVNKDYKANLALITSTEGAFKFQVTMLNNDGSPATEFEQALYNIQLSDKTGATAKNRKLVHVLQDKLVMLKEGLNRPVEIHAAGSAA